MNNDFVNQYFNLHYGEEDKQKTLQNVKSSISFKGSNLWILACAIIIASVGLNVNSTAVIIGAMLISPLMSPIVGAGFALGIYDFNLLKKSLINLFLATLVSLLVSALYFYLTPFKDAQSEILARTSPNIYDILIAFFGGLVGVIAITRVEKGNPIPGVAIATALMPPLCTAGYGLATANTAYFLGALFLYCINCVFICIATFIIIKYLKYPAAKQVDDKHQKQVKYGITLLTLLILFPSLYFAFSLYKEQKFIKNADAFIEKEFSQAGKIVVYKKTNYRTQPKHIELAFLHHNPSENELKKLNDKLKEYELFNTNLIIKNSSAENLVKLKNDILNEVKQNNGAIAISEMNYDYNSAQLLQETKAILPNVELFSISNQEVAQKDKTVNKTIVFYTAKPALTAEEKLLFKKFLQARVKNDSLIITSL